MNSYFSHSHIGKSAKFLSGFKKFNILNPFNDGLCIDGRNRISHKRGMQNAAIFGPSGSSKTVSYIIPNLMRLKNVSIYATDPSQELYNLCHHYLSKYFTINAINLSDISLSAYWNPLDKVKSQEDAKIMADAIISSIFHNESGSDIFWNQAARSIIYICLCSILDQPQNKTLFYVYNMLNRFNDNDREELYKQFSSTLSEDVWTEFKGLISQPEKVFGSQLATAKVALSPFSSPGLREVSKKSTIDFSKFRKKPHVFFIIIPEHRIKEPGISLYLSLLFREIFESLMEMPQKRDLYQYLLFDEAGNIFVPQLANYVTVLRKRRASVSLICQSTRQLYSLYKDDADTILENTLNHIYFPGLSLETCQKLSQKIGFHTGQQSSFYPTNKKEHGREALMSAESIRTLKNNRAIYIYGNLPALILRLRPWFKSFSMKFKLWMGRRLL